MANRLPITERIPWNEESIQKAFQEKDHNDFIFFFKGLIRALKKLFSDISNVVNNHAKNIENLHFFKDRGDPSSVDWNQANLTQDGNWHELDCSSIVSEGAVAILFHCAIQSAVAETNSYIMLRKNGNANEINRGLLRAWLANENTNADMIIPCDSNRKCQYFINETVASCYIVIKGWWGKL